MRTVRRPRIILTAEMFVKILRGPFEKEVYCDELFRDHSLYSGACRIVGSK